LVRTLGTSSFLADDPSPFYYAERKYSDWPIGGEAE
jgi:hypothetical protein